MRALGAEGSRLLLQYAAAEQMRQWLQDWESFEVVFGAFFFLFLLFGTREGKFTLAVALAMTLVAVCQRFITAPELVAASRLADFLPRATPSPEKTRLWTLETGYAGIQAFEWLLGGVLAALLVTAARGGSEGIRGQMNLAGKSNYGHTSQ